MKIVLIVIIGLVLAVAVMALVAPRGYSVSRNILINLPEDKVFNAIRMLKFQNEWSVWGKLDPDAIYTYTGTDGTVGFVSAWQGNKAVGQGQQEIKNIIEGERVDIELTFLKPFKSKADVYLTTETVSDSTTRVTWGMTGKVPPPMNIMLLFGNFNEAIGKDYEKGLQNLKVKLEN
jgi:hypothetical protein